MDMNIRIANQLVRLASTLVAGDETKKIVNDAIMDVVSCNTALNIGPGSDPILFFNSASEKLNSLSKKIDDGLLSGDDDVQSAINDVNSIINQLLNKYSPFKSATWRPYGGLRNDYDTYLNAYKDLRTDLLSLKGNLNGLLSSSLRPMSNYGEIE